jgi:hypothetical protein
MEKAAHDLRGQSVATMELRRELPGDVEVGNANQGYRRLAPVLAKLPSNFTTTDGHRHGGFKAWRARVTGEAALGARRRLGFGWGHRVARVHLLACGPRLGRRVRGGDGRRRRVRVEDGWRRGMACGPRLSVTAGGGGVLRGLHWAELKRLRVGPTTALGCA